MGEKVAKTSYSTLNKIPSQQLNGSSIPLYQQRQSSAQMYLPEAHLQQMIYISKFTQIDK